MENNHLNNATKEAAISFSKKWAGEFNESQYTQKFWLSLLQDVFAVKSSDYIEFEKPVKTVTGTKHIDAYIKESGIIIEQKSSNICLDSVRKQSDSVELTAYEQGLRYASMLPFDCKCNWIITCNFKNINIYKTNCANAISFELSNLVDNLDILSAVLFNDVETMCVGFNEYLADTLTSTRLNFRCFPIKVITNSNYVIEDTIVFTDAVMTGICNIFHISNQKSIVAQVLQHLGYTVLYIGDSFSWSINVNNKAIYAVNNDELDVTEDFVQFVNSLDNLLENNCAQLIEDHMDVINETDSKSTPKRAIYLENYGGIPAGIGLYKFDLDFSSGFSFFKDPLCLTPIQCFNKKMFQVHDKV